MLRSRSGWSIVAVLATQAACGVGADAEPLAAVLFEDSAGVGIVVNPSGSEARAPAWTVDPDPLVRIGVLTGANAYQFGRIGGLARLSDGRIVVVDETARELRYFDADGEHLYTVGGRGEGPGELFPAGAARLFLLPDDTVAVWTVSRLSLFHGDGEFVGAVAGNAATPLGLLWPRSLVVFQGQTLVSPTDPDGLTRQANHYVKVDLLASGKLDTLTFKVGRHSWGTRTVELQPGFFFQENAVHVPFTHPPISYIGHGRFAITSGVDREIEIYDGEGRLTRIVRIAETPEPLSRSRFVERTTRVLEELDPALRQERQSLYASMPAPAVIPAYSPASVSGMNRMLMGADGEIWIGRFDPESDLSFFPNSNPEVWTAFDGEGRVAGTVRMPERFTPYEITGEGVIGVYRDDLDVEYVQYLRVERKRAR